MCTERRGSGTGEVSFKEMEEGLGGALKILYKKQNFHNRIILKKYLNLKSGYGTSIG